MGPGSTTIRASVDGVTGTAHVGVVVADTTFALTQFNGSPLPVLIAADSVMINGVPEFDEVYADAGTLVLSGLAQERYQLDVQYSQYHVIRTGDTVQRELRFRIAASSITGSSRWPRTAAWRCSRSSSARTWNTRRCFSLTATSCTTEFRATTPSST